MKKSHPPNLLLVVSSQTSNPRTWVLEPEGRNTFRIVVVCTPANRTQHTA